MTLWLASAPNITQQQPPKGGLMIVVYSPKQSVDSVVSFSPSAKKPREFVQYLQLQQKRVKFIETTPVTVEDFYRAHDRQFVDDTIALRLENGFGTKQADVVESLFYTSGSFLTAAKIALREKTLVCSPTSGFHHASYDSNYGFCTFNGLMVTALHLKHHNLVRRVAIVDCDQHYGDGTADIIQKTDAANWCYASGHALSGCDHEDYLEALRGVMKTVVELRPDVVLYQAGADVHENDPLGRTLSTKEMAERERIVFTALKEANLPVAWNLAGGYQVAPDGSIKAVLDLHLQTFEIASQIYADKNIIPCLI
jgi:acetoin utilization deacetylase AcuC-like enzyme